MSRLENLPPDLRATLSLLLRQRKRHAEVAGMLGIEAHAVHDRAHSGLALLAPRQARELNTEQREQLGEYLLGQQSPGAEGETRAYLERSAAGRAWAQALASELAPLAAGPLPSIPGPPPSAASSRAAPAATPRPPRGREPAAAESHAPAAPASTAPSSRVGGAVVLGVIAAVIVVAVLLIVGIGGGGGSSHGNPQSSATATGTSNAKRHASGTSKGSATSTSTDATKGSGATTPDTGTSGSTPSHGKALTLTAPDPATSKAVGVAYVLTQKGQRAFYIFAKGLPALPSGSFYAVWLEGASSTPAYPLGSLPSEGSSGLVEGGGPLPSNTSSYDRIIVTSETSHRPSHPGSTVLGGPFTVE